MKNLNLKQKISFSLAVFLILVPVSVSGLYVVISSVSKYFSFPDAIVFSYLTVFCLALPLVFVPLSFLILKPVFYDVPVSIEIQKLMFRTILKLLGILLIATLAMRFYYLDQLIQRGYVTCQGTPVGWMPGMATKFAKNGALCYPAR